MKRIRTLLLAIMLIVSIAMPVNAEAYTVKDGDVLWKIARDYNVSIEALAEDNEIENVNRIYKGDILTIPSNTELESGEQDSRVMLNWTAGGFKQAESVLYVPNHEWLYTSNVNQEGVGYISRLSLDGEVDTAKFVDHVPLALGMAYNNGYIYAASQTMIKVIDIKSGEVVKELVASEGGMINDITFSPEGDLYATDFMTQRIYTSDGEKLVTWLTSDTFMMLNGIYFDNDVLLVSI